MLFTKTSVQPHRTELPSYLVLLLFYIVSLSGCTVVDAPSSTTGDGTDAPANGGLSSEEIGTDCVDLDQDGYGILYHANCLYKEIDCHDDNPNINPGQLEILGDHIDNNCDHLVDQCPEGSKVESVVDKTCRFIANQPCKDSSHCLRTMRCVEGKCKQTYGNPCEDTSECINGLTCENAVCSGDYCAANSCDQLVAPLCSASLQRCVECHESDTSRCDKNDTCTSSGWCGKIYTIDHSSIVSPSDRIYQDMLHFSKALAECWNRYHITKTSGMCGTFLLNLGAPMDEKQLENAYKNNVLNKNDLTTEEDNALEDMWGDFAKSGSAGWKELTFKEKTIPKKSQSELCLWFIKDTSIISRDAIVVGRCSTYNPKI